MRTRSSLNVSVLAILTAIGCGTKGDQGTSGDQGEAGTPGQQGMNGSNGISGTVGATGEAGATGAAGAMGSMGAQGAAGEGGVQGPAGEAGAMGTQGPAGEAGAPGHVDPAATYATTTKVKHLVVVFGENISFDHYFGTYPNAASASTVGGAPFHAASGTPSANNLVTPMDPTQGFTSIDAGLLTSNPTAANAANGAGAVNPFLLTYSQAATRDQGHNYFPEQLADNSGGMDLFPLWTGAAGPPPGTAEAGVPPLGTKGLVMGYYDGTTLSTIWSLAQNYAMNDNSWSTVFGPSTPGAINLIAGQTNGMIDLNHTPLGATHAVSDGNGGWTMIGDTDPLNDVCSTAADQNLMSGRNVGDLLNTANISWGFFEGGFDLTITNPNGTTGCQRASAGIVPGIAFVDYIPHHQPFQYYASTANPNHLRPSSVTAIGNTKEDDGTTVDPANHQYDSHDFFDALKAGNFPAVSYLKAPGVQDGHAGYSDPIDEQIFITQVLTAVQSSGD
jgi:phospholipase C